jgi:hypothetical protein
MLSQIELKEESAKQYLGRIREATCYSALRAFIKIVFIVLVIAIIIGGVGAIFTAASAQDVRALGGIAAAALALFVAIAAYQAAILLVDIADAQLESGRRKTNA